MVIVIVIAAPTPPLASSFHILPSPVGTGMEMLAAASSLQALFGFGYMDFSSINANTSCLDTM